MVEVILLKTEETLGGKGEKVRVTDGYARNYLFPQRIAVLATTANLKHWQDIQKQQQKKIAKEKEAAQALAEKIKGKEITLKAEAGDTGKLFGSVTSADLSAALKDQHKLEVDKRKIMTRSIKEPGTYSISVRLCPGVETSFALIIEGKMKKTKKVSVAKPSQVPSQKEGSGEAVTKG
jgi:large subunit ribosomal protein L9